MHGRFFKNFFGAATVGERGQVVIPQPAREALGIKPGDKLIVLGGGPDNHGLIMIKADSLGALLDHVSAKFSDVLGDLERLRALSAMVDREKDGGVDR